MNPEKRQGKEFEAKRSYAGKNPREIVGLNAFLNDESFGGNAGKNRAAANAVYNYNGQEFVFTNYPRQLGKEVTEILFKVITVPFHEALRRIKKGKPEIPMLIENYDCASELEELYLAENGIDIDTRVMQHNAFMIRNYLHHGGNKRALPKTPLMPTDIK